MKNTLLLLLFVLAGMLSGGCNENLPPPNPDKELLLKTVTRCPRCRKSSEIGKFERVNQVLGRCPFCKKVVNVMRGRTAK